MVYRYYDQTLDPRFFGVFRDSIPYANKTFVCMNLKARLTEDIGKIQLCSVTTVPETVESMKLGVYSIDDLGNGTLLTEAEPGLLDILKEDSSFDQFTLHTIDLTSPFSKAKGNRYGLGLWIDDPEGTGVWLSLGRVSVISGHLGNLMGFLTAIGDLEDLPETFDSSDHSSNLAEEDNYNYLRYWVKLVP